MSKYNCEVSFVVKIKTTEPIEADDPFCLQGKIIKRIREGKNLETRDGNGLKVSLVDIQSLRGEEVEERGRQSKNGN